MAHLSCSSLTPSSYPLASLSSVPTSATHLKWQPYAALTPSAAASGYWASTAQLRRDFSNRKFARKACTAHPSIRSLCVPQDHFARSEVQLPLLAVASAYAQRVRTVSFSLALLPWPWASTSPSSPCCASSKFCISDDLQQQALISPTTATTLRRFLSAFLLQSSHSSWSPTSAPPAASAASELRSDQQSTWLSKACHCAGGAKAFCRG